jgi:hypothetical protein
MKALYVRSAKLIHLFWYSSPGRSMAARQKGVDALDFRSLRRGQTYLSVGDSFTAHSSRFRELRGSLILIA